MYKYTYIYIYIYIYIYNIILFVSNKNIYNIFIYLYCKYIHTLFILYIYHTNLYDNINNVDDETQLYHLV